MAKANFSRQQFGGTFGGPVSKDKTFLFFALERARENTSLNVTGTAYSELAHQAKRLHRHPTVAQFGQRRAWSSFSRPST